MTWLVTVGGVGISWAEWLVGCLENTLSFWQHPFLVDIFLCWFKKKNNNVKPGNKGTIMYCVPYIVVPDIYTFSNADGRILCQYLELPWLRVSVWCLDSGCLAVPARAAEGGSVFVDLGAGEYGQHMLSGLWRLQLWCACDSVQAAGNHAGYGTHGQAGHR